MIVETDFSSIFCCMQVVGGRALFQRSGNNLSVILLWLLGGGLGGTRRGGPDVNIKHSGREDNERERERYRLEREREDRGGGGGGGGMDRRPDFRDRGGDRKYNIFVFLFF